MSYIESGLVPTIRDLDARGFHRGMWRMYYGGAPLFVVGVPFSEYS